ncbi:pentapeptide repeat-containing protein [Baaleninema sp.]|uniref:pentapeptide repeat-containing protein n=1 Tax=Baaleninema sp. TaxID=3101197 RepID=UPI003CFFE7F0
MTEKRSYHWLDTVEGLSLVGAVLGTGAGFVFQQVMYASAPVTLALVMNFVNRQRHHQQMQQQTIDRIANARLEVERQVELQVQDLREETLSREQQQPTAVAAFDIAPLENQVQALQAHVQQPMAAVSSLEGQMKDLAAQIAAIAAQSGGHLGNNLNNVAVEIPPLSPTNDATAERTNQFWQQYESGERSFVGINLAGADLTEPEIYLDGIDFSNANLEAAVLTAMNLGATTFAGANLKGAQLDNVNFARANLVGANLVDANLRGANLRGANLNGADLQGADLAYADLTQARLDGAKLDNANFFRTRQVGTEMPMVPVRVGGV